MRELALSSSLFAGAKISHIRNCVDPTVFNNRARDATRKELGLAPSNRIVLFSSANQARKGAFIIPEVMRILRATAEDTEWRFLFMGGVPPTLRTCKDTLFLPHTTDETRVAGYYAAADVYALPSLEDNLPNTVSESLCCGTPVASFPTGGIMEMVEDGRNGTIALAHDAHHMANAIAMIADNPYMHRAIISRDAQAAYSPRRIAEMHCDKFRSVQLD
jgi:glycosyltransferase involved in cell wall biosynthesis